MGRRRRFLCCFCCSAPSPPAYDAVADQNGEKHHHDKGKAGNEMVIVEQQKQQQEQLKDVEQKLDYLKGDIAKEIGYPLAMRLIHEVSAVFDPNTDKMSLRHHPNPWGWLHRNYDFKRALADQAEALPPDMNSIDAMSFKAGQIMAHSHRKFIKCYPEQLYSELKSFREKGYMEALKQTDNDLCSFLELSGFFATAFLARPRLLQLTTWMLQRVREELAIYWHTWEKLPFSWDERWHEAESWFQAALDCFKEHRDGGDPLTQSLPENIIELAREFDSIEEGARRIYGVNRVKEVGTFEQILHQFEQMNDSGLLTTQVKAQIPLCVAFLEYSSEIKNRYLAIIEKKKEMEDGRTLSGAKSASSLTTYQHYHSYSQHGSLKSGLSSSSRAKSDRRRSA